MRAVETFTRADGTTSHRVRFRLGKRQTSETFTKKAEAERFAQLLDLVGPQAALDQIYAEDQAAVIPTLDESAARHIASLTRITDGTRTSYTRIYKRTWATALGHQPINLITRHHIAAVINEDLVKRLSDKSIANAHGLLAAIMNGAILDHHIAVSPCSGIKLPRNTEHEATEMRFLTVAEYDAVWASMDGHFQPLLDFLAGTGCRWGEAEAVQAKAFNLTAGTVTITRAAKWDASTSVRTFGPPKSRAGRRTITLPPELVETLRPILAKKSREDLVFTMPKGGQLRHATFHGRYWRKAIEDSGIDLPWPRIHDLRHSHAAWLLSANVPIVVVQKRLGHEKITTTVDTYGHLLPETQAAAASAASLVFAGRPKTIAS
jgi:integrase